MTRVQQKDEPVPATYREWLQLQVQRELSRSNRLHPWVPAHRIGSHHYESLWSIYSGVSEAVHWARNVGPSPDEESAIRFRQREGEATLAADFRQRGIAPEIVASPRFDGTWCVWTRRGEHERRTLTTSVAMDPSSLLRITVNAVIDGAAKNLELGNDVRLTQVVCRELDHWYQTMAATETVTFTREHAAELVRADPGLARLCTDALNADPNARHRCLYELRERERANHIGATEPYVPQNHTWSLWTSRLNDDDRRLVVTDRAIDALAYHQLYPDPQTRYISFDGPRTPTRDTLVERAVHLLPSSGRVIIAVGAGNHSLARAVEKSARSLSRGLEHESPRGFPSWHQQLVAGSERRSGPSSSIHVAPRVRTGTDIGQ